ncbi:permease-like cell division protein FtsX [Pseudoramibacter sp.]|uniref:permease-like cell division protein FtsX n=1 Tax=Pseudoramibacter sp. TaxID=2034862 RepID=UPI0025E9D5B7|nr:permease-like cell division protein FtsX [Pseudoramibacter sp.]MCH4071560.1 permease-like cell division protein FtsX [Pseudoramibacter sp.]MCH4105328.1 permease-like cell division protein FtsX [Pseudoramibacter sp.]
MSKDKNQFKTHDGSMNAYVKSILKETRHSLKRNSLMGAASILSIVAALIILGIFVVFSANVQSVTQQVESKMELKVYVQNNLSQDQLNILKSKLKSNQYVVSAKYVSADKALSDFSKSLKSYSGLLNGYNSSNNPMPASFDVKIDSAQHIAAVRKYALGLNAYGVTDVKYGEEYVNALISFSHFSNIFSAVLIVILSVVSLFIVYNTIKLTCFARRKEIRVMRYVGATDWYIRAPFILEGAFLGALGAVIALAIIGFGYTGIANYIMHAVSMPMHAGVVPFSHLFAPLLAFCLIYGIAIGSLGSVFSMRKFLEA